MKKIAIILCIVLFIACLPLFFFILPHQNKTKECPFCNEKIVHELTVFEEGSVFAFYTYKPITAAHCLVIPKRHVERFEELSESELADINSAIKKVHLASEKAFGTHEYLVLQKNGKSVGQDVPHIHFHVIGRKIGDTSIVKFVFQMLFRARFSPIPLSENKERVKILREALST